MRQFNSFIRIHSKQKIEIKAEYPLTPDAVKSVYNIDCYLFYPSRLKVNKQSISRNHFIDNIQVYTRFSSPMISLESLVDPECDRSPLTRIYSRISNPDIVQTPENDRLIYELQTLCNIYRVETGHFVQLIKDELKKNIREDLFQIRIDQYFAQMSAFLEKFRSLHPLFMDTRITNQQREALRWADETISIITERNMNSLFSLCGRMESPENLKIKLEKITKKEAEYRKSMQYQYLFIEEDPQSGERLAYRESILKKWSQSAMYMSSEESGSLRQLGQVVAGIAAAVAMLFAVTVTILASRKFTPNSMPWILLIVLSYVFKDRIKESLRAIFNRKLPSFTSDQRTILQDPALKKKVGIAKGSLSFGKAGNAPESVLNLRYKTPNPFRSFIPEDDLMHYRRTVILNSKKLTESHSRLEGITEIVRFHIGDWLREMDDPKDIFYRLEKGKKIKIKGNRVYRMYLAVRMKEAGSANPEDIYLYRIVMNKSGILRIETP